MTQNENTQKCGWCLKRQFLLEKYSPAYTCEHCVPQPVPDTARSLALSHMIFSLCLRCLNTWPKHLWKKILTLQWHKTPHMLLTGWKQTVHRHLDNRQKLMTQETWLQGKKKKRNLMRLMMNIKELEALRRIKQLRWNFPEKFHQCTVCFQTVMPEYTIWNLW